MDSKEISMVVFNQKCVTLPSTDLSYLAQSLLDDELAHGAWNTDWRKQLSLFCLDTRPEWEG